MKPSNLELILHTVVALAILGAYVYTGSDAVLALLAGQGLGAGISAARPR